MLASVGREQRRVGYEYRCGEIALEIFSQVRMVVYPCLLDMIG